MTGILILARLGSTRLKRKHFIEVYGKSMIEWLILRIFNRFHDQSMQGDIKVIIATSDEPENREFESIATRLNCEVFYGDVNNIPLRQLECARHFNLSSIISIDGDDILCSTDAMIKVYELLKVFDCEIIRTSGLPLGMNVMGYNVSVLKNEKLRINSFSKLETGWGRIFHEMDSIIYNYNSFGYVESKIRMTLDYELDLSFFSQIINYHKKNIISIADNVLIESVTQNKFYEINNCLDDRYWKNFNDEKENEKT